MQFVETLSISMLKPDDIFVILSGDQLYRMDFSKMVMSMLREEQKLLLQLNQYLLMRHQGLGLLSIGEDAQITDFVEKPTDPEVISSLVPSELKSKDGNLDRVLASMGIYVFNASSMFDALQGDSKDFGKEIIPSLGKDKDIRCHIFDDYWEDIGTVRAFFDANLQLTEPVPSFDFYDEDSSHLQLS